ncbi:MAG: hypothetical protein ACOYOP_08005 [Microthrixaceae bacterium]
MVATVLLALAVVIPAMAVPAGAQDPTGPETSDIIVTEQVGPTASPCLPALFALRNRVIDTPSSFTLRIEVTAPLCEPVRAAGVVYVMPGKGVAWPQRLQERRDLTLQQPGIVEVSFTKGCTPVQFDVITGDSPPTVAPTGPWHGPLLFPVDTGTALQYWGDGPACPAPVIPEFPYPAAAVVAAVAVAGFALTRMRRRPQPA